MLTYCCRHMVLFWCAPSHAGHFVSRRVEARVCSWRCRGCHVRFTRCLGIATASWQKGIGARPCGALGCCAQITSRRSYACGWGRWLSAGVQVECPGGLHTPKRRSGGIDALCWVEGRILVVVSEGHGAYNSYRAGSPRGKRKTK